AAKGVRCGKLARPALTKTGNGCTEVRAYSIHGEVIRVGPLTVHTELTFFIEIAVYQHYSRRQVDKSTEAAAIQRHVLHEPVVNEGAHGCVRGIERRRTTFDRNALPGGADRHFKIDLHSILHVQRHIGSDQLLEVGFLHFNPVCAGNETRKIVFARRIRCRLVAVICAGTDRGDPSAGDSSFGSVRYTTAEGGVRRLGADCSSEEGNT